MNRVLYTVREVAWVVACFFGVSVAVALLLRSAPTVIVQFVQSTLGQLVAGGLVYVLVSVVVIAPVWWLRKRKNLTKLLGINKKPQLKPMLLTVPLWMLYMITTIVATVLVAVLMPWVDMKQVQEVGFRGIDTLPQYIMAFIALVVLPPVVEELLFRGYLYGRLRSRLSLVATSLVVSLVFGFVHMQWNVGIDTFILSLFLCYLRERTGSIWAGILLHALKNAFAYTLLFIAPLLGVNLLQ